MQWKEKVTIGKRQCQSATKQGIEQSETTGETDGEEYKKDGREDHWNEKVFPSDKNGH